MSNDHLANAREYIAKGDEFYAKAASEIAAAMDERPELTWVQVGRDLGRSDQWVRRLVVSFRNPTRAPDEPFEVDWQSGSNKRDYVADRVLRDPEQRKQVIRNLPAAVREEIVRETTETVVQDARAERSEHQTEPTMRELTGGDRFDPAEYWADTLVIRVNRNARELAQLISRAGGLLFGTMPPAEAFDYLHEAERLIAEARAAAQEIVRDKTEVGQ